MYGIFRTRPMDLKKSAGLPKSPDAKTQGELASSSPANIKAENPHAADAEAPVAPPRKAAGSPKKDSAVVPEGIRRRESYCLFIRVQKDVDAVSKRDQRIERHGTSLFARISVRTSLTRQKVPLRCSCSAKPSSSSTKVTKTDPG